jgi:hypothetical protein
MQTLLQLLENASHSSLVGLVGVAGIGLLFVGLIGAGIYRAKESLDHEDEH